MITTLNSVSDVWAQLSKANFSNETASDWYCTRVDSVEYERIKHLLASFVTAIIVKSDGPQLMVLQEDLKKRGVNCNVPNTSSNWTLNFMIIYFGK